MDGSQDKEAKRQKRKSKSIQIIVNNVNIESMLSFFVGENYFESHQTVKTKKMLKILYECLTT